MREINLNTQFAALLQNHGIAVDIGEEFIQTDLPDNVKFKARAVYTEINGNISSQLDVMALTDKGEKILESFGDYAATIEDAVASNFKNFSSGSLHPLLASLGCADPHTHNQITIEEWQVNNKTWKAYIGNLTPKMAANKQVKINPPGQFFESFVRAIKSQKLSNRLHWFRGYYCQYKNEITTREFLMDNQRLADTDKIFGSLPVIPGVTFYSCRNFIVLRDSGCY